MRLFLIRHGAYRSEYSSPRGPGLSERGVAQAQAVGRYLESQQVRPSLVITSGYLRADETADVLLTQLSSCTCERIVSHDFSPSGDPTAMRAVIEALDVEDLIVVGHMSSIGELAHALSLQAPLYFDTCTVTAFEYRDGAWHFLWFNDCGRTI